jgi:thiol:disulfide interchange protein
VLDSLLTLTKGGVAWMAGIFVVMVVADLGVSAITGMQEPIFLLLALITLVAFVVTGTYTLGKSVWRRFRSQGRDVSPPPE